MMSETKRVEEFKKLLEIRKKRIEAYKATLAAIRDVLDGSSPCREIEIRNVLDKAGVPGGKGKG
jgi:hypothetical protein